MERHNSRNTRSLCNTVRDLCEQPEERDIADEFYNSLTGLAGQVQLDEASKRQLAKADRDAKAKRVKRAAGKYVPSKKGKEDAAALYKRVTKGLSAGGYSYPKNMTEEEKKNKESVQDAMKRLAAKALKKARKKAGGGNKTDDAYAGEKPKARKYDPDMVNPGAIAEVAAPGTEDWASNPKVKKAFKERYGKRWKKVMYGRSWNMAKMDEETELAEGVSAKRMRIFRKAARKAARTGQPLPRDPAIADFMARSFKKQMHKDKTMFGGAEAAVRGRSERRQAAMKAKGLAESEQLDEAGYKKLMRLKKASYKADLASRSGSLDPTDARSQGKKHARLKRAAAEQEAKVAASMARRGGASADAIRAGGSLYGKRGKYTAKAAGLAAQRDKALGKFRGMASGSKSREAVQGAFGMHNTNAETKRKKQQAQAAFEKKARTGDFGQNNQEGMRPRFNYLKRTGKLKTKGK